MVMVVLHDRAYRVDVRDHNLSSRHRLTKVAGTSNSSTTTANSSTWYRQNAFDADALTLRSYLEYSL